ncbi:LysR substrate-binding domain-containing protein [Acidovorax sp. Leaf73]|uniref:LysR substrate-binding domain-containing protein n=1 Tax=Acidovorax sp. Leaf73 TaxID=2876566 RepID=UPI001E5643BF|nr:LysR substrate-binding domain-containing protein [Acidovorax sp. Leaf73]
MDIRHLLYFIAVAEELNFRRAAERVHIDQTPLSRAIRDLEERLGVVLFVRRPRRLELTPAGDKLLDHARRLVIRLERAKRVVRETDARYREPLRIGVDESYSQPKLAECLARWRTISPDVPLELTEMGAVELLTALRSEELDVGFSFGLPHDDTISQQPAWVSPGVAILSPTHELAGHQVLSLAELLRFPAIACQAASHPGLCQQVRNVLQQYSVSHTPVAEARTLTGYLTRVAAGLGVGIAGADHMRTLNREDIVVVRLAEPIHFTTYVVHKSLKSASRSVLHRFVTHATSLQ